MSTAISEQSTPSTLDWATIWFYIKQELFYLSWGMMEAVIIMPIALLVMPWARFWSTGLLTLWTLLLMWFAFSFVRFMSALGIRHSRQRLYLLIAVLLTIFVSWRLVLFSPRALFDFYWLWEAISSVGDPLNPLWTRNLIVFLVVVVCWWRGVRLLQIRPSIEDVGRRLRVGALIFAVLILAALPEQAYWSLLPFVLLYYLAGLTAVSLIRAEQIEKDNSGMSASVSPRWVGAVFLTSLMIIVVAGVLALLVSGDATQRLAGWFAPIWEAIAFGARVVLATFGYLATPLIFVLNVIMEWLVNLLNIVLTGLLGAFQQGIDPAMFADEQAATAVAEELVEPVSLGIDFNRIIVVLFVVGLIALVIFGLSRLYRQAVVADRQRNFVQHTGSSKTSSPGLGQRILERLGLLRNWRAATTIRRIYRHMCQAADGAGFPRGETETPYEYMTTLAKVWPDNTADSRLITEAYIKVRYGQVPESKEEFNQIREAWQRLETTPPIRLDT